MKKIKQYISGIAFAALCSALILIYSCSNTTTNPVTPTTITVSGKVLDTYGNSISAATVVIGSQNTSTAGDGSFTINNVSTPYDVYVLSPSTGVFGVKGLTISNPLIPGALNDTTTHSSAIVSIPTVPAGSRATVIFQDTVSGKISGFVQVPTGQNLGIISLHGVVNQVVTGKIYVLEYNISGGVVSSYTGYAEMPASFAIGSNSPFNIPALTGGLGLSTVSGTVNSSGGSNIQAVLWINFGSKNNLGHRGGFIQSIIGNTFSFNVPTGTPSTAQLNVVAVTPNPPNSSVAQRMQTLTPGASGVVINIDTIPSLLTPPNNATGIDTSTIFTFTNGGGNGLHMVRFTPVNPGTGRTFEIITKGNSFTIPNFSSFGYIFGSSIMYTWYDTKSLDINSTDVYSTQLADLNPAILGSAQSATFSFTSR